MNFWFLSGNLVAQPELKKTKTGVSVLNFTIAHNKYSKNEAGEVVSESMFVDCEAWDSGAEVISTTFSKGDQIFVQGSVKNESWTDAEGQKRTKYKLRVNSFERGRKSKKNAETEAAAKELTSVG